jgi:hypothetical protein
MAETTTTTNHDEDVHYWATQLRNALAKVPPTQVVDRVRAEANRARDAHQLSVPLLRQLLAELERSFPVVLASKAPRPLPKPFPNKKAQACERCGKWIEARQGICERDDADTRWVVSHPEDPGCPVDMLNGVPEGRYAINWGLDGAEEIKFYQIKQGVLYAQASAELWAINTPDHVHKALEVIKADPKAASILYGLKLGACGVCGRTLTNQESRELGIGPICIKKMGW